MIGRCTGGGAGRATFTSRLTARLLFSLAAAL
jgi:hypothetical protein